MKKIFILAIVCGCIGFVIDAYCFFSDSGPATNILGTAGVGGLVGGLAGGRTGAIAGVTTGAVLGGITSAAAENRNRKRNRDVVVINESDEDSRPAKKPRLTRDERRQSYQARRRAIEERRKAQAGYESGDGIGTDDEVTTNDEIAPAA